MSDSVPPFWDGENVSIWKGCLVTLQLHNPKNHFETPGIYIYLYIYYVCIDCWFIRLEIIGPNLLDLKKGWGISQVFHLSETALFSNHLGHQSGYGCWRSPGAILVLTWSHLTSSEIYITHIDTKNDGPWKMYLLLWIWPFWVSKCQISGSVFEGFPWDKTRNLTWGFCAFKVGNKTTKHWLPNVTISDHCGMLPIYSLHLQTRYLISQDEINTVSYLSQRIKFGHSFPHIFFWETSSHLPTSCRHRKGFWDHPTHSGRFLE